MEQPSQHDLTSRQKHLILWVGVGAVVIAVALAWIQTVGATLMQPGESSGTDSLRENAGRLWSDFLDRTSGDRGVLGTAAQEVQKTIEAGSTTSTQ